MSSQSDDVDGANEEWFSAEKKVSRFRVVLPQVLASMAKNLIWLDIGMTVAFSTVVIPALHNADGPLTLNDEEISWLGSITYICQPVGSIVLGPLLEPMGRKYSMILVNLPLLVGWLILYLADSSAMLYSASVIMGLGIGIMEAPSITYLGEISQPELRGILTSCSNIFVQLGFVLQYLMGSLVDWRIAAISSASVPIITAIAITQIPESPMWLLSRGRTEEAEKALCWLRGWVPPAAVQQEFRQLLGYHNSSQRVYQIRKSSRVSENLSPQEEARIRKTFPHERHRGSQNWAVSVLPVSRERTPREDEFLDEVLDEDGCCGTNTTCSRATDELMSAQTLHPLLLVIGLFFFSEVSAVPTVHPYMVEALHEFDIPVNEHWATVIIAVIGMCGNVLCMALVSWCGKKPLELVSLAGCAVSSLLIGGYAYALLSVEVSARAVGTWAPLTLFVLLFFSFNVGAGPIPWMVLSEVFPFRARSLGSGIAAGVCFILIFIVTKTYLLLRSSIGLSGVFWLYGCISVVGVGLLFWKMPETEGKTLEEIEDMYGRRRSLGKVLANLATITEAPILISPKARGEPSLAETSLSVETLNTSLDSIATVGKKRASVVSFSDPIIIEYDEEEDYRQGT